MEAKAIEFTFSLKSRLAKPGVSGAGAVREEHPAATDDSELVKKLTGGSPEALAQVYDRYAPSLYRVLQAWLGSAADTEDALQEVFVKLATGRFSRIRELRPYLFVAARHEAFDILRRRRRESQLENSDLTTGDEATQFNSDNGASDWQALLARLPLEQREVVALKIWEQMTFAEIARIVKVSPNTAASRYRYGIERLRSWCEEEDRDEV